jgi:hypothetical protein
MNKWQTITEMEINKGSSRIPFDKALPTCADEWGRVDLDAGAALRGISDPCRRQ